MYGVSKISSERDIMLITFPEVSSSTAASAAILKDFAEANVIVDMISQTAPKASTVSLSFTCSNQFFPAVMQALPKLREKSASAPLISSGFTKLNLYGKDMVTECGVCANALQALSEKEIGVLLITTSDLDISLLIRQENEDVALQTLSSVFSLTDKA